MRERSGETAPDRRTASRLRVPARATEDATVTPATHLLRLQSQIGNRGVTRLLARSAAPPAAVQRARYPTSERGRLQRPPFDTAIAGMDYLEEPDYTASAVRGAGGAHSTATPARPAPT